MNSPEKRKSERFIGEIPIKLKQGTGLTRDCSAGGVFFVTDQPVALGEQVEFFMLFEHTGLKYPVRLRCRGDVVRMEQGTAKTGVAVTFSSHLIETMQA
jgi:hypothetical protein